MRQTPQEQPESMEFPRREFESVCFHAIGLVDQNREYLQMHLRESGDAPTRQALADMELQTARLERTLSEMMDLMALEEDPVPSRRGFDLCSVLRQAASLREEMARQAKVHLTVSCEPDTCPVLGSPEEAELMVFHLLSNALRASAPGGKIVLRLCRAEDAWQLTVTDHGCGLARPGQLAGEPPPFSGRCGRWPEDLPGGLPPGGLGLCAGSRLRRRCRGGCDPPHGAGNSSFRRYHRPARGRGGAALPAALAAGTGAASAGWECLKAGFSECRKIS